MPEVSLTDALSLISLGAISVPLILKPLWQTWQERNHVWVGCESLSEAKLVANRVWAYTEMRPRINTEVDLDNTPHIYVQVPKRMLGGVEEDALIEKLKEPLNV